MNLPSWLNAKKQTPGEEAAERMAEASPLLAISQLVGLQDHQATLSDHRQRVRDSHRMGAKALGLEAEVGRDGDPVGDINVQGDSHYYVSDVGNKPGSMKQASDAAKMAAAAALGAGAILGVEVLTQSQAPVAPQAATNQSDENTEYTIRPIQGE